MQRMSLLTKEELAKLESNAAKGNADAQFTLGRMYKDGIDVKQDTKRAFALLEAAANQGHVESQSNVGEMYQFGVGAEQDLSMAALYHQHAAALGNPISQNHLGTMCLNGMGLPKNDRKAFEYFQAAAEQKYANAQYNLGFMYAKGITVPIDDKKAYELFLAAAMQGYAPALKVVRSTMAKRIFGDFHTPLQDIPNKTSESKLSPSHEIASAPKKKSKKRKPKSKKPKNNVNTDTQQTTPSNINKSETESVSDKKDSTNQAFAIEQYNLGVKSEPENMAAAIEFYKTAAKYGHVKAQMTLAEMHTWGVCVPEDKEKAAEFYQAAANQGNSEARCQLGVMYLNGMGVPKDEKKALELFKAAAKNHHPEAYYCLGNIHELGRGVPKNNKKAANLYQNAADLGYVKAQSELGAMYHHGVRVVQQDYKKAIELYKKAAAQGDPLAQSNLGAMHLNGSGMKKDAKTAGEFFEAAAKQGYADAQYNLGILYTEGLGVLIDDKKALELFQAAANQNHAPAKAKLNEPKKRHLANTARQSSNISASNVPTANPLPNEITEKKPSQHNEESSISNKERNKQKPQFKKPMNNANTVTEQIAPSTIVESETADQPITQIANLSAINPFNSQPESTLSKLHARANWLIEQIHAGDEEQIKQEKSEVLKIKNDRALLKSKERELNKQFSQIEGYGQKQKRINSTVVLAEQEAVSDKKDSNTITEKQHTGNPNTGISRNERNQARLQSFIAEKNQEAKSHQAQVSTALQIKAIEGTVRTLVTDANPNASQEEAEKIAEKILEELEADNVSKPVVHLVPELATTLPNYDYNNLKPLQPTPPKVEVSSDKKEEAQKSKKSIKQNKMHLTVFHDLIKLDSQHNSTLQDPDKQERKSESVSQPTLPLSVNRSSLFAANASSVTANPAQPIPSAANGSTASTMYPIHYLKPSKSEPKPTVPTETSSIMYKVNPLSGYK